MKLLISIPVHEAPEVVVDHIKNIRYFVPAAKIVLHISKNFSRSGHEEVDFSQIPNVLINPTRYPTKWGDLAYPHYSNFRFAEKTCDFDYIALHASNEMFIKKGVEDYISAHDAGVSQYPIREDSKWSQGIMALRDPALRSMLKHANLNVIQGSSVEGTFYKREVFSRALDIIDHSYQYGPSNHHYAREEIYLPTLAAKFAKRITNPYTFVKFNNAKRAPFEATVPLIEYIRNEGPEALDGVTRFDTREIFSVKSIPREIDHPVRTYVRTMLQGK